MATQGTATYLVARLFNAPHREALYRAALFAQGGEFAFVLYAAALRCRHIFAAASTR